MIAYYIAHVNRKYQSASGGVSPIVFVDQDEDYNGHRFCNKDIFEPDTTTLNTYFYHIKDAPFIMANASDFAGVNTATCDNTER
jgi:hypothetical protein